MDATQHAIESLRTEIDRIVVERQELRRANASPVELEENRGRLVQAQSRLSRLLIRHHLHQRAAAA